jgi:tetratricopeptide (TPR) repeat protein
MAIQIDPKYAPAHNNLGLALKAQNKVEEAIACHRMAIQIDPKLAPAHLNLGNALKAQNKVEEAIACYRMAIQIDPKYAPAHGALGEALLQSGRFAEAKASTQRCLDLLPERHPLRAVVTGQLQKCDRLLALEAELPAILEKGAPVKNPADALALAQMCLRYKKLYAAAAGFYADAFAAPKLPDNLLLSHRYDAARAAALAGCRKGADAAGLGKGKCSRLREQALDWLRADLAVLTQAVADDPREQANIAATLQDWQQNPDLTSVRHPWALLRLPADERKAWQHFWTGVAALLRKAETSQ